MIRPIALLLSIAIFLGSCTPATTSPTPLPTVTITQTITPSETPSPTQTPIPETAEQKIAHAAQAAYEVGWMSEDETTWGLPLKTDETKFLANMKSVDTDPSNASLKDQETSDTFITDLRRIEIKNEFFAGGQIKTDAMTAVNRYIATPFSKHQPGADTLNSPASFATWVDSLSRDEINHLEKQWCNVNGKEYKPTVVELREWTDGFNAGTEAGNTLLSANFGKEGHVLNGFWERDSLSKDQFSIKTHYMVTMFGQEHMIVGDLGAGDIHRGFLGAALRLPYGKQGIEVDVVGPNHEVYERAFVVSSDGNYMRVVVANTLGPNGERPISPIYDPKISVTTNLSPESARGGSLKPLTWEVVLNNVKLNKVLVTMIFSGEPDPNGHGGIYSTLLDPDTMIPVIGNSQHNADLHVIAGLQFLPQDEPIQ